MSTPVYQPAHGLRRGDPVVHDGASWAKTTGSWDGVVGLVYDLDRFEIITEGIVTNLAGLIPGDVTYADSGGTIPVWRALSQTSALLLKQLASSTSSAVSTVTTTVASATSDTDDDLTVALRRSWLGM